MPITKWASGNEVAQAGEGCIGSRQADTNIREWKTFHFKSMHKTRLMDAAQVHFINRFNKAPAAYATLRIQMTDQMCPGCACTSCADYHPASLSQSDLQGSTLPWSLRSFVNILHFLALSAELRQDQQQDVADWLCCI